MEWQKIKSWIFTGYNWIIFGVFVIAILWLSYVAITSLLAGSIWYFLLLLLLLLYFLVYVMVFNVNRWRFPSRLTYQIAFIVVTWIFIALMLGVELMHSGSLRQQDGLKAGILAVAAALFLSPGENMFSGMRTAGGSGGRSPEETRTRQSERQMPESHPDLLKPLQRDTDLFEYDPYRKK